MTEQLVVKIEDTNRVRIGNEEYTHCLMCIVSELCPGPHEGLELLASLLTVNGWDFQDALEKAVKNCITGQKRGDEDMHKEWAIAALLGQEFIEDPEAAKKFKEHHQNKVRENINLN